jgi:hypothetical protein
MQLFKLIDIVINGLVTLGTAVKLVLRVQSKAYWEAIVKIPLKNLLVTFCILFALLFVYNNFLLVLSDNMTGCVFFYLKVHTHLPGSPCFLL